jgi:cell division septation protein DedD
MAERERRRFEFGWLEVLGLVLIFAGGSAVVFFLGIFVGKGLQESRLAREERVVRLPIGPSNEGQAARDNELPLYNELAQGAPSPTPGVALAVKRPAESGEPAARLAQAEPTAAPRAPVERATVAPGTNEEMVRASSAAPAPPPADMARRSDGGRPTEATRPPEGTWSVQVNATKDETVANGLVKQLQERGYNAYVVRVSLQGEAWYRVRVGRFPTMEAATAVVMRLKNEERYSRAFLVNE